MGFFSLTPRRSSKGDISDARTATNKPRIGLRSVFSMQSCSATIARRHSTPDTPAKPLTVAVQPAERHSSAGVCRFVATSTKLGSGAYGAVVLGRSVHTSVPVAIKFIPDGRMRTSSLDREVSILQRLSDTDHPALVKFYGHLEPAEVKAGEIRAEATLPTTKPHTTCHALVMEVCRGGELFDHVVKCEGLKENESAPLCAQLCDAVRTAHDLGIAHRDLKLENVLLVRKKNAPATSAGASPIKLIDWGLAHQHALRADGSPVAEMLHSRCGSRSYMAPEVTNRDISGTVGYDGFAADMWSLGVCLFAMHLAFFPFEQANPELDWRARRVAEAQRAGKSTMATILSFYPQKSANGGLSKALISLLDRLLVFDPKKRATMPEVLCSEWLAPHVHALAQPVAQPALAQPIRLASTRTSQSYSTSSEGPLTPRAPDEAPTRDVSRISSASSCASMTSAAADFLRNTRLVERQDSTGTVASTMTSSSVASSGTVRPPQRSLELPMGAVAGEPEWANAEYDAPVPPPPPSPLRKATAAAHMQVVVAGGACASQRALPGHATRSPAKHRARSLPASEKEAAQLASLLKACKVAEMGSPRKPDRGSPFYTDVIVDM